MIPSHYLHIILGGSVSLPFGILIGVFIGSLIKRPARRLTLRDHHRAQLFHHRSSL